MTTRNERVREYLHVALDKVFDHLIETNNLERAGLLYFSVPLAFKDVDENTPPGEVKIERRQIQQWTNQTTTP